MTSRIAEVSPRQAAVVAGVGYLALFVLAIFANFVVREGLIEPGDAAATAANIVDSEGLFRAGLIAFRVVFVIDVPIAWALYVFFKPVSQDVSLLTAWFRLVYTAFLGVALVFFFMVLELLGGADHFAAFDAGQLDAQVMLFLDAFNFTWLIGLAAFGLHLLMLGYLVLQSGATSRVLGYLLMLAGVAYIVDTVANGLLADYDDYETLFLVMVAVPSVVGEMWLGLWLLFRGGRQQVASP